VIRRLTLAIALVLVLASCGLDVEEVRIGPVPLCDTTSRGMLILMAQAVPEADYVPCFSSMPDDWALESTEIETGGAELSVDRKGVGDVEIEFIPSCAPTGSPIALDLPSDVEAFETGTVDPVRWLVFPGGCVVIESVGGLDLSKMVNNVSLLSRADLRLASDLEL
jgi:hypothetical protein